MNRTITLREAPQNPAAERGSPFMGPMRLADLVFGMWAIVPAALVELQAIYEAHLRGPKIDIEAIEARMGRPLANEHRGYEVTRGGVAVFPIEGVISPKMNMLMRVSGGASAQLLTRDMRAAGADPSVKSILQVIDSPGGNVLGVPEYAEAVREVSAVKPVVSFTDGQMASGGYWFGSSGNSIYASGPTVEVGSIGVITTHRDFSAANEKDGVKVTHISAGKYKALGSPYVPLSKTDRASIQDSVDYLYSIFVDAVAAHRGVSADTVLQHMADGRIFRGQQALDVGLIDGFSPIDALIEQMATDPTKFAKRTVARIKPVSTPVSPQSASAGVARVDTTPPTTERMDMTTPAEAQPGAAAPAPATITAETIQQQHPHVHAAILAAGAAAERKRVADVRAQSLPGHDTLIEALVTDGKTTGPEAAMAVLAAERGAITAAAQAHAADAPRAAPHSAAQADNSDKPSAQAAAAQAAIALFNQSNGVKQHA